MIPERPRPVDSRKCGSEFNLLRGDKESKPVRDISVTRRDFMRRCGAGLLGAALGATSSAAPAVTEYRRGGMTYRRLGRNLIWNGLRLARSIPTDTPFLDKPMEGK